MELTTKENRRYSSKGDNSEDKANTVERYTKFSWKVAEKRRKERNEKERSITFQIVDILDCFAVANNYSLMDLGLFLHLLSS